MKKHPASSGDAAELRRRAKHQLRKQRVGLPQVESKADAQRTLQELQIHQIELELQNEELKQSKIEVDAGLEKFTDLYEFAPVGYFSLNEQGLILEVNLTGATSLGIERSRLTRRRFQSFVAPRSRPAFQTFLEKIFSGFDKQVCEVSLLQGGSKVFSADLQAKSAVVVNGARKWCRMAVIDISARKLAEEAQHRIDILAASNRRLEEEIIRRKTVETELKTSEQSARQLLEQSVRLQRELRDMTHRNLLVQERQRKKISRALHDEISQLLVGINLHLAGFAKQAVLNPKGIRRAVAPMRRLVKKSVQIVHQFARELRPAMLDDLGLIPTLRSYIDELPRRKGQRIDFAAFEGVEDLDNDKRTVIYRVAQEALINVGKYARATVVNVAIHKAPGGVQLEIADDGKGFELNGQLSAKGSARLGLIGMRERVEMVGGRFTLKSAPGVGTTVRAEIPFGKQFAAG
jgi:PAS domain S-box-containing protein